MTQTGFCVVQTYLRTKSELRRSIQHRTVLIISLLPPDKHPSSDAVYRRRGDTVNGNAAVERHRSPRHKILSPS